MVFLTLILTRSVEYLLSVYEGFVLDIRASNYQKISKDIKVFENRLFKELRRLGEQVECLDHNLVGERKFFERDNGWIVSSIVWQAGRKHSGVKLDVKIAGEFEVKKMELRRSLIEAKTTNFLCGDSGAGCVGKFKRKFAKISEKLQTFLGAFKKFCD